MRRAQNYDCFILSLKLWTFFGNFKRSYKTWVEMSFRKCVDESLKILLYRNQKDDRLMDPNGVTYPASLTCEMQNIQKVWHFLFSLFVTQCSTVRAHQGASVHKRSHQAWEAESASGRCLKNKSLMKTVFTQSSTSVWIWLKVEGRLCPRHLRSAHLVRKRWIWCSEKHHVNQTKTGSPKRQNSKTQT